MKPSLLKKITRLENKARRLWNARTASSDSWQNITATALWDRAQSLRKQITS